MRNVALTLINTLLKSLAEIHASLPTATFSTGLFHSEYAFYTPDLHRLVEIGIVPLISIELCQPVLPINPARKEKEKKNSDET